MGAGVPQGSVLGPLLFCIYVRHAPRVSLSCSALLYADDISLCAMAKSLATGFAKPQADLDNLLLYLDERGLLLNPQKTQLLIIRRPKKSYEIGPGAKVQRRANCACTNCQISGYFCRRAPYFCQPSRECV